MVSATPRMTPVALEMPVRAPALAALKLTKPPSLLPSWLLLMVTPETTDPVFDIPVKAPDVALWLIIVLLLNVRDTAAPLLIIPVNAPVAVVLLCRVFAVIWVVFPPAEFETPMVAPVPVFVAETRLLPVMFKAPVPPVFSIPFSTLAAVPKADTFIMLFPEIVITPVAALVIPLNEQIPVVVTPLVPMAIECAVVLLPIWLPEITILPRVPAV